MADYKDIISGTISNIIDKVKGVADSGVVKDVYEQGASKAKSYGRIAKLSFELNGDNEELKHVYTEIGKLYFELNKNSTSEIYAPLFAQASEIASRIEAKEQEIQHMKNIAETDCADPDIDVEVTEFDVVVDETANDGAAETPDSSDEPKE